jgi:hypothetical protein
MKTFEVELRRTSYVTITVEADNEDHAEELAWQEVQSMIHNMDSDWAVESTEEIFL